MYSRPLGSAALDHGSAVTKKEDLELIPLTLNLRMPCLVQGISLVKKNFPTF